MQIPKYSGDQYNTGRKVPQSQAKRGDLLFWGPGGSQHVAIYFGGGKMLEASGSAGKLPSARSARPVCTPPRPYHRYLMPHERRLPPTRARRRIPNCLE